MSGSSRPVLAIRCEKQARVSPRPKGGARVQAHGHEETWPPGMPLAHELSSSPIRTAGKSWTSRSRARFTRGWSGRPRLGPECRQESQRGDARCLGAGEHLAPAARGADWSAEWAENGPKRGQDGDLGRNMLRRRKWCNSFILKVLSPWALPPGVKRNMDTSRCWRLTCDEN